jgi:hypothetical protein
MLNKKAQKPALIPKGKHPFNGCQQFIDKNAIIAVPPMG